MKHANLTSPIIDAAIEVHRNLGPGLLESAYKTCLAHEIRSRSIACETEHPVRVRYKGVDLDCGYRVDLLVNESVIVELKSLTMVPPICRAQLLTYMRLSGVNVGLLINFNMPRLVDGIVRMVD